MRVRLLTICALFSLALLCRPVSAQEFDHSHARWDQLLQTYVHWNSEGTASRVDYAGLQKERGRLDRYLESLSAVRQATFDRWSRDQQLAFLINAYNAFTVKLILDKYPDLTSIRDLGRFFRSPWERRFFVLLGEERHLDDIEHNLIRGSGRYNEPLIHFAVNCASLGCPPLRDEAFVADRLDEQLRDSTRRFLQDRDRNAFDAHNRKLYVSSIFDWYAEDFSRGWRGYRNLHDFFRTHAEWLTDSRRARQTLQNEVFTLDFLEYDWRLNAYRPPADDRYRRRGLRRQLP